MEETGGGGSYLSRLIQAAPAAGSCLPFSGQRQQAARSGGRRQMPLHNGLRDFRQRRTHLRVGAKGGFQPCINALPHPRQGLLLAALCQGAIGGLRGLKFGHGLPEGVR